MTKKKLEKAPLSLAPSTKKRWLDIIEHLSHGLRLREVALDLKKSYTTIKHDAERMREYFGAQTNLEAVLLARREWNLDL